MVEGLSCLFYVFTQQATAAAENWFYFVEKARTGGSWLWNQKNSHCAKNRELIDILIEK